MSKAPILTFLTQEGLKLKEISNLLQTSSKGAATLLFHLNSFPLGTCTSTSTSVLSFYTLVSIYFNCFACLIFSIIIFEFSVHICMCRRAVCIILKFIFLSPSIWVPMYFQSVFLFKLLSHAFPFFYSISHFMFAVP